MRVEDVEKAVRLKRSLDEVHGTLKELHELGRTGVDTVKFLPCISGVSSVSLSEVSFGQEVISDALQVFVRVLEARYNEIHAEITAL